MKKLFQIIMITSMSLFMTSCYYDSYIELPEIDSGEVPTGVSFKDDVQALFTSKCAVCHNGSVANPDLREGNAYNAIVPQYVTEGNADNSSLVDNLPGISHPINAGFSLSANEIALVKAWINEGAENN